jgi:integrase
MFEPRRLPSGLWWVRWREPDGRRPGKAFATKAQASEFLARKQVQRADHGGAPPAAKLPLAAAAAEWLATRPEKRRRANASHLALHILPFLGERRVGEVPRFLPAFLRHLESKRTARPGERNREGRTLRPATIANVCITLRKLLNDLRVRLDKGALSYKVPTSGYGWIQKPEDVARFLDACRPQWFRIAAALSVYAGLRKGEVAGLRVDALDFDRGLIRVDRSYDGPTKGKLVRWAPLSPALAAILRPWVDGRPGAELVVKAAGEPLTARADILKRTRRACRRAGIAEVTFHQLRHTAASHLAQRVPLPMVGAVLGHADPKTTARYAHLDTEGIARSPRLQLDFSTPADPPANVVALPRRSA